MTLNWYVSELRARGRAGAVVSMDPLKIKRNGAQIFQNYKVGPWGRWGLTEKKYKASGTWQLGRGTSLCTLPPPRDRGLSLLRQQEKNASHLKTKSWAHEVPTRVSKETQLPGLLSQSRFPSHLANDIQARLFLSSFLPQTTVFVAVPHLKALPENSLQTKWFMDKRHQWVLSLRAKGLHLILGHISRGIIATPEEAAGGFRY